MIRHIRTILDTIAPSKEKKTDWKIFLLGNWKTVIGDLHEHVSLQKVYKDALLLGVYDSCWLQELYLLSPLIIARINQTLDAPHIKRIHFKQVPKKEKACVPLQKEMSIPVHEVSLSQQEKDALEKITDESLRTFLHALRNQCRRNPQS